MNESNNTYQTKNTSLAAFLYMEGFSLLDVFKEQSETRPKPISVFVFQDDSTLQEKAQLFQTGKAEGNLILYFEAYRKCLKMTHIGKL